MRFKLFGLIWDFRYLFGAIWAFVGLMLIGLSFFLDVMGWWIGPYILAMLVYLATARAISEKLEIDE